MISRPEDRGCCCWTGGGGGGGCSDGGGWSVPKLNTEGHPVYACNCTLTKCIH